MGSRVGVGRVGGGVVRFIRYWGRCVFYDRDNLCVTYKRMSAIPNECFESSNIKHHKFSRTWSWDGIEREDVTLIFATSMIYDLQYLRLRLFTTLNI